MQILSVNGLANLIHPKYTFFKPSTLVGNTCINREKKTRANSSYSNNEWNTYVNAVHTRNAEREVKNKEQEDAKKYHIDRSSEVIAKAKEDKKLQEKKTLDDAELKKNSQQK